LLVRGALKPSGRTFERDHDEPGDANRPKPGRVFGSGLVERGTRTGSSQAVGFAVVLFVLGEPAWLHERWFLIGAVVSVVCWQAAEIYGFSKARLQIYNDPESTPRTERGTTDV
jgi:ATP synthase protein I